MLTDINFKNSYTTGYAEPKEFMTEALIESKQFDLGLGFFSSSAIRCLAYGFAIFIANGGKMRIIINHILSDKDKQAIENGQELSAIDFEERIIADIDKLNNILSKENEHFFKCLSYLISINRIEFVATISTNGGLGHDKYGIFTDEKGNKVAFVGSANFSRTALEINGETITVFKSDRDYERIKEYEDLFNESWVKDTPHLRHIPLSKVKTHIAGKFPKETLDDLIQKGMSMRDIEQPESYSGKINSKPLPDQLIEKMARMEAEPRFPFPNERQIQKDAYSAWIENKKQGIFAMATGSGKTVTALNCVLKQYKENGYYKVIIAVPTKALAEQWEKEAKAFKFNNIVSTQTDTNWKDTLARYATMSRLRPKSNIIIITTYATFNRKHIQEFLSKTCGLETFIYIADEAHNLGTGSCLANAPHKIIWRIGLSATPERIYDEIGSGELYKFFNSAPPKYTYRYTMKQAIEDGILCKYEYYPIFVSLNDVEMDEYERITKILRKFIDSKTGKYKPEAEKKLLERKRIIHKAENKKKAIQKLLQNLQDNKKLDYTFVFVPEGYEPDYSQNDNYAVAAEDVHIIDEYADLFKSHGYSYHKYISGLDDAQSILDSFAKGDIKVLLSMKCLDEGVDIPRAENAIFCASTGNPRQFVQRRGRVLRKAAEKEKAKVWDLIVTPPDIFNQPTDLDKNLFTKEVQRIVNFATLAYNKEEIIYGELKELCDLLDIPLMEMIEKENNQYN